MIEAGLVVERALAVYESLRAAGITCAIGGALALNYAIDDPRATRDIDMNVTLPKEAAHRALTALPPGVPWTEVHLAAILRDGQVRIMWPVEGAAALPLDLFFAESDFHEVVAARARTVPMLGQPIEVISATDLTIFKSIFGRSKDWVDIEAMLDAHDSTVDLDEATRWVEEIVGPDDPRAIRLRRFRDG